MQNIEKPYICHFMDNPYHNMEYTEDLQKVGLSEEEWDNLTPFQRERVCKMAQIFTFDHLYKILKNDEFFWKEDYKLMFVEDSNFEWIFSFYKRKTGKPSSEELSDSDGYSEPPF